MELSEKEKKAIERLKLFEYRYLLVQNDDKVVETIINLVDKLQKETEREKQYSDFYEDLCNKQQKDIEELIKINIPMSWEMKDKDGNVIVSLKKPDDYISKDKIREKREEIQSYAFTSEEEKNQQDYAIARFNELLEEK